MSAFLETEGEGMPALEEKDVSTAPVARRRGPKKHTFTKTQEGLLRYLAAETAIHGSVACTKSELARIVGRNVKTVDRSISDLRRRGYVEVEMNFGTNGAQVKSTYRVVLERCRAGLQGAGIAAGDNGRES